MNRILACLVLIASAAVAQTCPGPDGGDAIQPSQLHGTVRYHDGLRQWIGLQLDKPACDEKEIQLTFDKTSERQAKALSGCRATVTGVLFEGMTGYYSTDLAVMDAAIAPDVSCKPAPLEPDVAKIHPPSTLHRYHARIVVDYPHNKVVLTARTTDAKRTLLLPVRAYIDQWFTSSLDVLNFGCAKGFIAQNFLQTPQNRARPEQLAVDLSQTVLNEDVVNTVTFDCVRSAALHRK